MNSNSKLNLILASVAIVGITLSCWGGWFFYNIEEQSITAEFQRDVDERAASIHREIMINFETLRSLAILFNGEGAPDHIRFRDEAKKILSRHGDIQALEWVPRVVQEQRSQYESSIRTYYPNYEIKEQNERREMVTAANRPEYFPVYFVEPLVNNKTTLGFDISSCPIRQKALVKSRDSAMPQITTNIMFVPENEEQNGFIAFLPIYTGDTSTVDKRRDNLLGFVLGVYRYHSIITNSALGSKELDMGMRLVDITSDAVTPILHTHKPRTESQIYESIVYRKELPEVWGRKWALFASPTISYVDHRRSMLPWIMFDISFLGTAFIVWYIRMNVQRTVSIKRIVRQRTNELSEANKKLALLSHTDALTGIANRRAMDEVLNKEWLRAIRNKSSLSFILVDIDFFKLYNDNYGHPMGDECLKKVAATLNIIPRRPSDLVVRYGGEEFAFVLPETENAEVIAEDCRSAIEALKIKHSFSKIANVVTISVGFCTVFPKHGEHPAVVVDAADKALYQAKKTGRNKVCDLTALSIRYKLIN
jgi:diguanylate cyclase (GGDEF)-like protein